VLSGGGGIRTLEAPNRRLTVFEIFATVLRTGGSRSIPPAPDRRGELDLRKLRRAAPLRAPAYLQQFRDAPILVRRAQPIERDHQLQGEVPVFVGGLHHISMFGAGLRSTLTSGCPVPL